MKISFIAENDWANVLTEYSYCLNKHSEGIEAKSICLNKHPYNYSNQHDYDLSDCTYDQGLEAQKFVFESDIVIFGEEGAMQPTNYKVLEIYKQILGLDLLNSDKKLLIWHPGTHYRQNFNFYNNHPQRNKIFKHLYAIDLYRLSPKNDNDFPLFPYQYLNFNYDKYISDFKNKIKLKPWSILHIPSNSSIKGTKTFKESIDKLKLDPKKYIYKVFENIPFSQVLKEKEKSIFYLDQVNVNGGYGLASLEAIFLSNLTFSSSHYVLDSIEKLTGKTELPFISLDVDPQKLQSTLKEFLLNTDEDKLISIMEKFGKWVKKYNSPEGILKHFNNLIK